MSFYPGVPQQGVTPVNVVPATSSAATAKTHTIAGTTGSKIVLRKIIVLASTTATATLVVNAGSTTVLDLGTQSLTVSGTIIDLSPGYTFGSGVTCNVVVGSAGGANTTTGCLIADRV